MTNDNNNQNNDNKTSNQDKDKRETDSTIKKSNESQKPGTKQDQFYDKIFNQIDDSLFQVEEEAGDIKLIVQ